ncbi:MAG: DUF1385 domain-containing protein [Fimbriimonadales bacterium]
MHNFGKHLVADKLLRVTPAYLDDSLLRCAELMAQGGAGFLPIVEQGEPVGVLTEARLRQLLASGTNPLLPVSDWTQPEFLALRVDTPVDEALLQLSQTDLPALVVDPWGRYVGVATTATLLGRPINAPQVGLVGGMATPLGVYLTNGAVRAGAGAVGLMLTGAILFLLLLLAQWLVIGGAQWAQARYGIPLYSYYNSPFAGQWYLLSDVLGLILRGSTFVIFLLLMRLTPIAGIHAAEHMVVHAIERGEPLVLEVVRRMPRVHPRCGTNLVAGIVLFLGLSEVFTWGMPTGEERQFGLLMALLATLMFWRTFGALLQWVATTKPPTDAQLLSAIRVGEELLQRVRPYAGTPPPLGLRLLNSGLFQIIIGSWIALAIVGMLEYLLGITLLVG